MTCNLLLTCSVLLLFCSSVRAHPVTDMTGSDWMEEADAGSPEDLSIADVLQRAAESSRDVTRQMSNDTPREVILEKSFRLVPSSGLWGSRRKFRKRGSGADCFWKYCV